MPPTTKQPPSNTLFVGIDPGIGGGVAMFCDSKYYGCWSMPVIMKKNGRREIDAASLHSLLSRYITEARTQATQRVVGVCEQVSARPGQGVSSMFSFGDSFGVARTVLALLCDEVHFVSPVVWKRHLGLIKQKKDVSRSLALRMFPAAHFQLQRKLDEGRAEALLLAHYATAQMR